MTQEELDKIYRRMIDENAKQDPSPTDIPIFSTIESEARKLGIPWIGDPEIQELLRGKEDA